MRVFFSVVEGVLNVNAIGHSALYLVWCTITNASQIKTNFCVPSKWACTVGDLTKSLDFLNNSSYSDFHFLSLCKSDYNRYNMIDTFGSSP